MSIAIRKVRHGRVKIGGLWFSPRLSTNRFDGTRQAFGLYYQPGNRMLMPFVSLWGSEKMAKYSSPNEEGFSAFCKEWNKLATDKGYFLWQWWERIEQQEGEDAGKA